MEKSTAGKQDYAEYRKKLTGKLDYEAPTRDLNHFEGIIKLKKDPKHEQLSINNLILRGSVLRNTEW